MTNKIFLLFLFLSPFSLAGRIIDDRNSSSSSSSSSWEDSSDESDDEVNDEMDFEEEEEVNDNVQQSSDSSDELTLERDNILQEMPNALQPRSFFSGEILIPRLDQADVERPQRKRAAEDSEDKPKKKKRVQSEDNVPERLRAPMPAVGGILGALLESGVREWHEPFFDALEPLDILSLYAASHQANLRMGNNLVLTIHNRAELDRLLSLPTRTHAFLHIIELHFDIEDAEDDDDARIISFLRENAAVLSNLQHLTFEPANDLPAIGEHILTAATQSEGLAHLLLRTEFELRLLIDEEELQEFWLLLPLIQRLRLNEILDLRVYDDENDLQRRFLERFPRELAIHGLYFHGSGFGDGAIMLFGERLQRGYFRNLRDLQIFESDLQDEDVDYLIHIAPQLQRLQTLDLRGNPDISALAVERLRTSLPQCTVLADDFS